MVNKINRYVDEHCSVVTTPALLFSTKNKQAKKKKKQDKGGIMASKEMKWDLREKRRKEREMSR